MPRLSPAAWETVRAEFETGASLRLLEKRHGVSNVSIFQRSKKEGWTRDPTAALERLVSAKLAGIPSNASPEKKAKALDAAANRKTAVIDRHKAEWDKHRAIIDNAISTENFDAAKLAKITAETLAICQAGERRAWGLESSEVKVKHSAPDGGPIQTEVAITHHVADAAALAAAAQILAASCVGDAGEDTGDPG